MNPLPIAASAAGDLNHDGIDDVAVAYNDHRAQAACGLADCHNVAIVFGADDLGGRSIDLRALGTDGYTVVLDGAAAAGTISDIAPIGDYDGDGIDDLAIGAVRRLKNQATRLEHRVRPARRRRGEADGAARRPGRRGGRDRARAGLGGPLVRRDGPRRRRLQPGRARRHPRRRSQRRARGTTPTRPRGAAFVIFGRTGGAPIPDVKRLRPTEGVRIDAPPPTTEFGNEGCFAGSLGGLGDIDGDGAVDLLISHRGLLVDRRRRTADDEDNDLLTGGNFLLSGEADTDGDGLTDAWETRGIDFDGDGTVDLRPSELDASPDHKDVFVEMDAMDGHMPDAEGVVQVIDAFEHAPVANPDGRAGITCTCSSTTGSPMPTRSRWATEGRDRRPGRPEGPMVRHGGDRAAGPARLAAKRLVFHYALWIHGFHGVDVGGRGTLFGSNMALENRYGGRADAGDDPTTPEDPGLDVDARTGAQPRPPARRRRRRQLQAQLPSVMNYPSSHPGMQATFRLDFSRSALATLDEAALDESLPIAADPGLRAAFGPQPIVIESLAGTHDYNRDGRRDDGRVGADLNNLGTSGCGGAGTVLIGHDDWSDLRYDLRNGGDTQATAGVPRPPALPVEATDAQLRELSGDADHDAVNDFDDNCLGVANAGQADSDHDGRGDACDATPGPPPTPSGPPKTPPGGGVILAPPSVHDPPAGVSGSTPDRTPPAITRFARKRRGFSFRLSEPATVTLTLERRQGRRYRRLARLTIRGRPGQNTARYTKKLRPGRYRATITAIDAARNRAPLGRLAFRR